MTTPLTYMPDLFDMPNPTEEPTMTTKPEAKEPRTIVRLTHPDVIKLMKLVTANSTMVGEFLAYDPDWNDKRARQALIEQLGKDVDVTSFLRNRREIGWLRGEKEAANSRSHKQPLSAESLEARVISLERRMAALENTIPRTQVKSDLAPYSPAHSNGNAYPNVNGLS